MASPKKLTARQRDILNDADTSNLYVVAGCITDKWYIYFQKCDKYSNGYDSKEDAEADISSKKYLEEDFEWYNGNTLVI